MSIKKLKDQFDRNLANAQAVLKQHAEAVLQHPTSAMQWSGKAFNAAAVIEVCTPLRAALEARAAAPVDTVLRDLRNHTRNRLVSEGSITEAGAGAHGLYRHALVAELARVTKLFDDIDEFGLNSVMFN